MTPQDLIRRSKEKLGNPQRAGWGGVTRLAEALLLRPQTVHQWREIPAEHVLRISQLLDLDPHEIRPDLYPEPYKIQKERACGCV